MNAIIRDEEARQIREEGAVRRPFGLVSEEIAMKEQEQDARVDGGQPSANSPTGSTAPSNELVPSTFRLGVDPWPSWAWSLVTANNIVIHGVGGAFGARLTHAYLKAHRGDEITLLHDGLRVRRVPWPKSSSHQGEVCSDKLCSECAELRKAVLNLAGDGNQQERSDAVDPHAPRATDGSTRAASAFVGSFSAAADDVLAENARLREQCDELANENGELRLTIETLENDIADLEAELGDDEAEAEGR